MAVLLQLSEKFKDWHCAFGIFALSFLRVITTRVQECPQNFDCNSYIDMMSQWWVAGEIPGHHAMRILPSMLARIVHELGLSVAHSFQVISGGAYVGFGLLSFYVLIKLNVDKILAFSGALLCISFHEGLRVSLVNPYQACDALVYPMILLMFYATYKNNIFYVFILSVLGVFVRQNIVIFALLCFSKIFFQNYQCSFESSRQKSLITFTLLFLTTTLYIANQTYFQATGVFLALLSPPNGWFDFAYWGWTLIDSQLINILFPIVPLLLICWRESIKFLKENWHILLYGLIVVGQPTLGYYLTGNNYPRLACQGIFLLAFMVPIVFQRQSQTKYANGLVLYALLTFSTWGILQRAVFLLAFMIYYGLKARRHCCKGVA